MLLMLHTRPKHKEHIGTRNFREELEKMQVEYTNGGGEGVLCSKVVTNYVNELINEPKKVRFMGEVQG
jgi:hypothetical protein